MTQARHEYSARRGQESYDAETVDSVSSFSAASKAETLQAHDSASTRGSELPWLRRIDQPRAARIESFLDQYHDDGP
jgi:hypothetical protein